MTATVPSMIGQFNMNNIQILQRMGYEVDVACDFNDRSVWTTRRVEQFKIELNKLHVDYFQVDYSRSPLRILKHIKSYQQLNRLVKERGYDFIHCHTPVASVISRIVAHENRVKIIYTAHGFHFYDGAPKKNWMIYYPIERFFSKWTDILITINREDYNRANKKFKANKVVYIPGVGLDTEKFDVCVIDRLKKRKELGIPEDGFALLSVGELQNRKNQRTVIDALGKLKNRNIYYLMVGKGELYGEYMQLVQKYRLQDNIKLLGFRTDIDELCKVVDCFVHPSVREGLGIAPLEAMASGLPLIASYINGIKDYTEDGVSGCCIKNPTDVKEMIGAIEKIYKDIEFRKNCGNNNKIMAKKFDIKNTDKVMRQVYEKM